ncbi:GFA family protein [Hyphomonas sp.]|uniref:GFA family protein n=1 Tax=Hyphomonas sp. TaxID=87 RepID=UPI0039190A01
MTDQLEGGCTCRRVRYRLKRAPIVTHCCHCSWCQRETGSAFVINAVIESSEVELLGAPPEIFDTPSLSGRGQLIARCPRCLIAVWSHYPTAREAAAFIRVGTLDDPKAVRPDVHIFRSSAVSWLALTDGKPAFDDYYPDRLAIWGPDAMARWEKLMASRS